MRTSGEETKARIERAAIAVFAKSGVTDALVKQIAETAGVSQGAMYNHYPSKEELAWVLFARSWAEIGTELRRRVREGTTLRQKLRAAIQYVFDLYKEDPALVTFVYFSRHEHLRKVRASMPNPYMVFRLMIAEAMKRGEIPRRNPEVMTAMTAGILIQVIDSKALGRIREDLSELTDMVTDGCYRLLAA
ncbi:MAG TPA: TetR/AcrR family transcriptional regulator [Dongiaceae bacterium]